jgi:hypothetical protein
MSAEINKPPLPLPSKTARGGGGGGGQIGKRFYSWHTHVSWEQKHEKRGRGGRKGGWTDGRTDVRTGGKEIDGITVLLNAVPAAIPRNVAPAVAPYCREKGCSCSGEATVSS